MTNVAIGNGPVEIVDKNPLNMMIFPVRYVNVYQRYIKKLGLVNGFLAIVLDLLEKNQFRFFWLFCGIPKMAGGYVWTQNLGGMKWGMDARIHKGNVHPKRRV